MIRARSFPALACLALLAAVSASGQGPLTPPGAPAPTMRTLDQIEPRTPIPGGTAPYVIATDGSYYLTGNLASNAAIVIRITANNVTLDLNGFTISPVAGTNNTRAINYEGAGSVTIRNGHIRSFTTYSEGSDTFTTGGFDYGVTVANTALSTLIENVEVTGVGYAAITVNGSKTPAIIRGCQVSVSAGFGIQALGASVDHCQAKDISNHAIEAGRVSDSSGASFSTYGIHADTALNSTGTTKDDRGIFAGSATNCIGTATGSGYGLFATNAVGCGGSSASGNGLYSFTASASTGSSTSGIGLRAEAATACSGNSSTSTGMACNSAVDCRGSSTGGTGLFAQSATNCYGGSGSGIAIQTTVASHCYANSGTGSGIVCVTADHCFGQTGGTTNASYAIDCSAQGIATGCRASATGAGAAPTALRAFIADSCVVSGGTIAINYKYSMP